MNTNQKASSQTRRMHALLAAGVLAAGLCLAATTANATPLTIQSVVGGAPTGTTHENFDTLNNGDNSTKNLPSGITISFVTDAQAVTGAANGLYAAPVLSGSNGTGFGPGGTNQADGADATTYITTGSTGNFTAAAVTLWFPANEKYMGILWGSVDDYNTLTFWNGSTQVGTITGTDVSNAVGGGFCAGGNQTAIGTCYVNINSTMSFDHVVATSSQYAFEFDNVAFDTTTVGVPEPGIESLFLLGLLLVGSGYWLQRRKLS